MPEKPIRSSHRLDPQHRDEAVAASRAVVEDRPGDADAHVQVGRVLCEEGDYAAAIRPLLTALSLNPAALPPRLWLGRSFRALRLFDQALDAFASAAQLQPDSAEALRELAYGLKDVGRWPESLHHHRSAIALAPDDAKLHGDLVVHLAYQSDCSLAAIRAEQAAWYRRHAATLSQDAADFQCGTDPTHRLRLAYVSPYLREHAEAPFLAPVLAAHDRSQFEVHCYSTRVRADARTAALLATETAWHDVSDLDDAALAARLRADAIDILIDTALHFDGSRLLAFARRPAPLQLTWLALNESAGLSFFDHRISDPFLDAPGETGDFPLRLSACAVCFQPLGEYPEPGPLPAKINPHVTFGCLHNFHKVSPPLLRVWAQVLAAVPGSRLVLTCPRGSARARAGEVFASVGVDTSRLEFVDRLPLADYRARYCGIDIALDSFPYHGCATTCDALWMGVPVITLAQPGRFGPSLLHRAGLGEFVATDELDYVRRASALALDTARLAGLRSTLRATLTRSPLLDTESFTRELEQAYRRAWSRRCAR